MESASECRINRGFDFDANGPLQRILRSRHLRIPARHNRISDSGSNGTLTYQYDPFNRMNGATKNGVFTTIHVDPLGRRIFKWNPGASRYFVFAPDNSLLTEMDGSGNQTNYLWMGSQLVGMVRNSTLYAIHTDQLGRPELVTDPNKSVVWKASNFAFDSTVTLDSIGGLNIGFPGQYYDTETNLWNNGFRDYDATTGRYVESDPLGLNAGINTFGYVGGNPICNIDPSGLDWSWQGFIANRIVSKVSHGLVRISASGETLEANPWGIALFIGVAAFDRYINAQDYAPPPPPPIVMYDGSTVQEKIDQAQADKDAYDATQPIVYTDPNAPPDPNAHNLGKVTVTGTRMGQQSHAGPGSHADRPFAGSGTAAFDATFSGAYDGTTTYGDLMSNFGGLTPDDTSTHVQ